MLSRKLCLLMRQPNVQCVGAQSWGSRRWSWGYVFRWSWSMGLGFQSQHLQFLSLGYFEDGHYISHTQQCGYATAP